MCVCVYVLPASQYLDAGCVFVLLAGQYLDARCVRVFVTYAPWLCCRVRVCYLRASALISNVCVRVT